MVIPGPRAGLFAGGGLGEETVLREEVGQGRAEETVADIADKSAAAQRERRRRNHGGQPPPARGQFR